MGTQGAVVPTTEQARGSTMNSDNPLTLQNSDNLGLALVMVLVTNSNYLVWSRSIRRALVTKNKLGFINETLPEPTTETERSPWRRADEMVSSWIINSISKDIVETFVYSTSTRRLWIDHEEQYGESNGPKIYQLQ